MEEIKAGIDLGTTNSAVAVIGDDGKPFIVVNGDGNRITPSVVGADSGNLVVGDNAKDLQSIGCIDTAAFFKRPGKELRLFANRFPETFAVLTAVVVFPTPPF